MQTVEIDGNRITLDTRLASDGGETKAYVELAFAGLDGPTKIAFEATEFARFVKMLSTYVADIEALANR